MAGGTAQKKMASHIVLVTDFVRKFGFISGFS